MVSRTNVASIPQDVFGPPGASTLAATWAGVEPTRRPGLAEGTVTLTRMYRWLVRKAITWLFAELRAGRPRWFLALLADDVQFRFPGEHSWAADYHGKEPVRRWLAR